MPKPTNHRRVLVVDDNRDSAESLSSLLSIDGHQVETAFSGPDAIARSTKFRPEFVFLDIGMPGMDGYAVAGRLKESVPSAVLVALSGWSRDSDRDQARQAGFDYHLAKPASEEEIAKILNGQSPRLTSNPK